MVTLAEYRAQLDQSSIAHVIFNSDLNVLYANPVSEDVTLKLFGEVIEINRNMVDFVQPSYFDTFKEAVKTSLGGQIFKVEKPIVNNEGETFWFYYEYTPFFEGGQIQGTVLKIYETTEKNRSKHAIKQYKKLFGSIEEGVSLLNKHGDRVWCNKKYCNKEKSFCSERCAFISPEFLKEKEKFPTTDSILEYVNHHEEWSGIYIIPNGKKGLLQAVEKKVFKLDNSEFDDSRFLVITKDITELEVYKHRSDYNYKIDRVTGAYNRNVLETFINAKIDQEKSFALFTLDIDAFNRIVRLKGYDFGDRLLKHIVTTIQEEVPNATIFRSHGDSFFFMVDYEEDGINAEAQRHYFDDFEDIKFSYSMGVSIYPKDATDAKSLILNTEKAMHIAKEKNGISLEFYHAKADQDLDLEAYINNCLITNDYNDFLSLHFQPIMNARTESSIGYEVLIRWLESDYGYIGPDKFISIAEKNGMISKVTKYVLDETIKIIEVNRSEFEGKYLSINISIIDLMNSDLRDHLKIYKKTYPWLSQYLQFEITETSVIEDLKIFNDGVSELRALGFKIAIDDFGTGYSSVDKLVHVEFDVLKIDKSFIDLVLVSKTDYFVLENIVSLAKKLNLDIIAEGIETIEQVSALKALGISNMQGYYYHKPMTLENLIILIQEGKMEHR